MQNKGRIKLCKNKEDRNGNYNDELRRKFSGSTKRDVAPEGTAF